MRHRGENAERSVASWVRRDLSRVNRPRAFRRLLTFAGLKRLFAALAVWIVFMAVVASIVGSGALGVAGAIAAVALGQWLGRWASRPHD